MSWNISWKIIKANRAIFKELKQQYYFRLANRKKNHV